jgi:predicted permease
VAFVLLVSVATTFLFALLPAWKVVRDGVSAGLREAGGRATSRNRLRIALLTAQVALCGVLLSGTSLLLRGMQHAARMDPGFRHEDVILFSSGLQSSGLSDEQAQGLIAAFRERLTGLPGVTSVAYATVVPLGNSFEGTVVENPRSRDGVRTGFTRVSAGFFETLGIPVLAGRTFTPSDEGRKDLVIISQALANRLWPGENPLGKNVATYQVVGVVRDVGTRGLGSTDEAQMYIPSQGVRHVSFFVRHHGPAAPLLGLIPKAAGETDRRFFASAIPYSEYVDRARRSAAVAASMGSVFSVLALCLAFVGLYAVAAYQVSQRTREIGVRMALGAKPGQILRHMIAQNIRPVVVGSLLGIAGALALARLLTSLLYGVSPTDPAALLLTILMLSATAFLAVWPPARSAATVDPASALRSE